MIARKWVILLGIEEKGGCTNDGKLRYEEKKEINGFIWLLDECMR
jgi:hypothetical protein